MEKSVSMSVSTLCIVVIAQLFKFVQVSFEVVAFVISASGLVDEGEIGSFDLKTVHCGKSRWTPGREFHLNVIMMRRDCSLECSQWDGNKLCILEAADWIVALMMFCHSFIFTFLSEGAF